MHDYTLVNTCMIIHCSIQCIIHDYTAFDTWTGFIRIIFIKQVCLVNSDWLFTDTKLKTIEPQLIILIRLILIIQDLCFDHLISWLFNRAASNSVWNKVHQGVLLHQLHLRLLFILYCHLLKKFGIISFSFFSFSIVTF